MKHYGGSAEVVKPAGWRVVGYGPVINQAQAWIDGSNRGKITNVPGNPCSLEYIKRESRIWVDPCPGAPSEIITDKYFDSNGAVKRQPIKTSEMGCSWFDALPDVKIEVGCNKSYGLGGANSAEDGSWWLT